MMIKHSKQWQKIMYRRNYILTESIYFPHFISEFGGDNETGSHHRQPISEVQQNLGPNQSSYTDLQHTHFHTEKYEILKCFEEKIYKFSVCKIGLGSFSFFTASIRHTVLH